MSWEEGEEKVVWQFLCSSQKRSCKYFWHLKDEGFCNNEIDSNVDIVNFEVFFFTKIAVASKLWLIKLAFCPQNFTFLWFWVRKCWTSPLYGNTRMRNISWRLKLSSSKWQFPAISHTRELTYIEGIRGFLEFVTCGSNVEPLTHA